ncbi:phage tail assembly chaperone [Avibacterium sp. 21-594]|uniref:phage tail assembly chaperone n=1 Tax=Avibacterium sp. 21-594 TaxID=2911535 RepID=UPI00224562DE|nr:hypothetical protein [Avibacterium sp. 21-594]MCW9716756.1 hypothetical protein [Avibacterium sp. 21-594]
MAVYEQTGIMPAELDIKPPPEPLEYLLDYFYALSLSRQSGMSVNPILYSEILAWSQLTKCTLEQWELEVIKQLDMVWLSAQIEENY